MKTKILFLVAVFLALGTNACFAKKIKITCDQADAKIYVDNEYVAQEFILYSAWASRCRFYEIRQCEGLSRWNWQRQVSRFFCMPLKLLNNQLNNKRRQPKIR